PTTTPGGDATSGSSGVGTTDSPEVPFVVDPPVGTILPPGSNDGTRYVYEDAAAYRARLERAWDRTAIPGYTVTVAAGSSGGELVVPGRTYLPVTPRDNSLLSVVSFDVTDAVPGPDSTTAVAGVTGQVYASASSLFVWATNYGNWWDVLDQTWTTNIYMFDLGGDALPLVALGSVPGMAINQFALDETADGFLRVATTSGWGDAASSGVFVLAVSAGGNLRTVGSVTGLAPGERIHSVRFIGDRGYVSTFRQVDPLFVIDLSRPTAPRVVGELKIPGFSSYLHPLDDGRLLGIGRDVDPVTGEVLGLQLSIFDVSIPANPRRTATYTFPGAGWSSWSAALWDHHALSWFAKQGILAIPVQQGGWSEAGSNGLVVFKVDPGRGGQAFTNLGRIDHDDEVTRSVRVGNYLYSVSWGEVRVHRIDAPATELGRVRLAPRQSMPWAYGGPIAFG
ncbi:MAG: beta-propeller domain-containing protein, partial [Planctomycetaceae bacterium]